MSFKRQATSELNRDNWDQDDPADHEDMGTFKTATKDVLEKRVIKTAKRRFHTPVGDEANKSAFSGFEGFKKSQPTSFEFLSNLTNGTKTTTNGSLAVTTEASISSNIFGAKATTSAPNNSLFLMPTIPVTSEASLKATNIFGPALKSSVFQSSSNVASPNLGSIFSTPKVDYSTEQSPFKIPSTTISIPNSNNFFTPMKTNPTVSNTPFTTTATIFSLSPTNTNQSTSSKSTSLSKPINTQISGASPPLKRSTVALNDAPSTESKTKDTNKITFYSKLACLNKAVTEWIKKHVEDTPLCILTPIFKDYEKYLKELQVKYGMQDIESEIDTQSNPISESETKSTITSGLSTKPGTANLFSSSNNKPLSSNSPFDIKSDSNISKEIGASSTVSNIVTNTPNLIGTSINASTFPFAVTPSGNVAKPTPTFLFGMNDSVPNTINTTESTSTVTLGVKPITTANTSTTFSFGINNSTTTAKTSSVTSATFSFGIKSATTTAPNLVVTSTPSFSFGIPTSNQTSTTNSSSLFSFTNNPPSTMTTATSTFSFGIPTSTTSLITTTPTFSFNAKPMTSLSSPTTFSFGMTTATSTVTTPSTFSFSPKSATKSSIASPSSSGMTSSPTSNANTSTFSFAMKSSPQGESATTLSPFSFNMNSPINTMPGTKPFSFGTDKPFSFKSSIENKAANDSKVDKEEEEEPPKVEFTPVIEENSVYDKRCKIFVKKDGNFVDKGVGILYVKKIEESDKHQLLVRANTNLGNVLVNFILSKGIPIQKMGKNNVMMVCIPTPEAKPPPTPILIRVKTSEEADELLETLKKFI